MKYTVQGYLDGISYALVADTSSKDEDRGIIAQAPGSVIGAVAALTGQEFPASIPGPDVEVSLTDPLGLLVGLAQATQITKIEGDLPDGWPGAATDDEVRVPVVY